MQQRGRRAFTLIELLVVMGIIALLMVLLVPAFTNRKTASEVTTAANGLKNLLDQARTHAQAKNTYVFVGFAEVDSSVRAEITPQVAGNGRVAVAAVVSKDGTRQFQYLPYGTTGQGAEWTANYNNGANLTPLARIQVYENLHFNGVNFPSWAPTSHPQSNMARYQPSNSTYNLGTSTSVTPFTWPLGSSLTTGYHYKFEKVLNFDPRGAARITTGSNGDEVTDLIEIDFLPMRGTAVPAIPTNQDIGNHFVIQVDAATGAVRLYRP